LEREILGIDRDRKLKWIEFHFIALLIPRL